MGMLRLRLREHGLHVLTWQHVIDHQTLVRPSTTAHVAAVAAYSNYVSRVTKQGGPLQNLC